MESENPPRRPESVLPTCGQFSRLSACRSVPPPVRGGIEGGQPRHTEVPWVSTPARTHRSFNRDSPEERVRPPHGSLSSSFYSALRIPHSVFLSSPLNSLLLSRAAPCTSVRNPGQIPPGRREEFQKSTRRDWFPKIESVRWRESDYTARVNTGGQRVPTSELQRRY